MRRLIIIALVALFGWLPATAAQAQAQVRANPPQIADGIELNIHPVIAVIAGAVTGVVLASAVTGTLVSGSLLLEGASLAESLEAGTGLSLPLIGASAVLGGMLAHLLFNR